MTAQTASQSDSDGGDYHLQEYLQDAELQGLTDETLRLYKSNLKTFFKEIDCHPESVDRRDLRDFLSHL